MRHTAVHCYGTICQLKLKGQETQIASNTMLKNYYLTKMEHVGLLLAF